MNHAYWTETTETAAKNTKEETTERAAKNTKEEVLGIMWRTEENVFTFRTGDQEYTKRRLLSKLAGIFDPLGLASIITIKQK